MSHRSVILRTYVRCLGCGVALPKRLEQMEPDPVLALFLSTVDLKSLSGFDRVRVL